MRKAMIGATVIFCGHRGFFLADIMQVGSAFVVRANGPVTPANIIREGVDEASTHIVSDMWGGFWRPDLGVFVVPSKGLTVTKVGKAKFKAQEAFRADRTDKEATKLFARTKKAA
jgi:hypothetical protein